MYQKVESADGRRQAIMHYAYSNNLSNIHYEDDTVGDILAHFIPVESTALQNFIVPVQIYKPLAASVAPPPTSNDIIQDIPSLVTASELIDAVSDRSMDPVNSCAAFH